MKYCTKCLYPDTKPDIVFNEEGVCSACTAFEARKNIDWDKRENQFREICNSIKNTVTDYNPYHCIVPVSGGKDSHYQIIKVMEYGLKPLAVTAITDDLSYIGRRNLSNIGNLGCDHIYVGTNTRLRNTIARYALETVGDISWAEHVTIFTVPVNEAILRNIRLIIYGENPQNEYGGPSISSQTSRIMTSNWLNEFGGLNGLRVYDIIDKEIATKSDMRQYLFSSSGNLWPECMYLGQFFDWDGYKNYEIAAEHGFMANDFPVEGSGFHYENLDNYQTGIHDRFKYLKFGFGRATDICNNHIRRGRMTRKEAIWHINEWDGNYPDTYLGKDIRDILEPLGLNEEQYKVIEDRFTNKDLFEDFNGIIRPKFEVGK